MQQVSDIEKLGGMNEHLPLSQAIIKRYYDYADDLVDTLDKDDIFQTEDGVYQFIGRNEQGGVIANQLRFDYIQQKYYNTYNEKVFPIGIIAKYDDRNNILYNSSYGKVFYKKDNKVFVSDGIGASWEYNKLELENGDTINCSDIFLTDKFIEEKGSIIMNYGKLFIERNYIQTEFMERTFLDENKGILNAIKNAFTIHPEISFIYSDPFQPYLNLCFTTKNIQFVLKLYMEQENVKDMALFTFNGNYDFEYK